MSNDQPDLRASHEDRNRVVETLQTAGGDGRLSAEELDDRVERALSARTLGELAPLTADLSAAPATEDVLVIEQDGGKYVKDGRWRVPARIDLRTKLCRVTLDFSQAAITSGDVRIEVDMTLGKLIIVTAPDVAIDTNGLTLTFSKIKRRSADAAEPRLRIRLVGKIAHAKIIEQRP